MKVNLRGTLSLFLGLIAWASPAAAQSAVGGPFPSVLLSGGTSGPLQALGRFEPADSLQRDIRPTYWKEGALVGGLVGLAGGAFLGLVVCAQSDQVGNNCVGTAALGALGGALILAIPGALIGGQMHKGEAAE